jgi:hypothetical protein
VGVGLSQFVEDVGLHERNKVSRSSPIRYLISNQFA